MGSPSTRSKELALLKRQIGRAMELSLVHLECRVGGTRHRWERVRPLFTFDVGITTAHQCDNCYAIKHECFSPKYGERLHRPVYTYPEGYLVKADKGERAMSPAAVRAALGQRINWDTLPEARPVPGHEPKEVA